MNTLTKQYQLLTVLGWIIVCLLLLLPGIPVLASDTAEVEKGWIWTKERPKPSWWRWDTAYYKGEKPVRGGYYQTASARYVGLMNPNHWPVNDFSTLGLMYDHLIYSDGKREATVPWLATNWTYENPKTVLMTLRNDVTFHDGSKFNAHSVKYQIEWIQDKKNRAFTRSWIKPVKTVEIVDDYTVRWHLHSPWASFADIFAFPPGWMISTKALKADVALQKANRLKTKVKIAEKKIKKAVKKAEKAKDGSKYKKAVKKAEKAEKKLAKLKKQLNKALAASEGAVSLDSKAVGSADWMIEEARPGNYLKLKRNPNWWFGKSIGKPEMPYFDGRKITIIPDPSIQLANLRAGKLDDLSVEKSQYALLKNDPNLNVYISPLNFTVFMAFNHKSVLKDIRLRKAVSHAIDRKALIAANSLGFDRPASCFYPPEHFAHNPNLKPVEFNPVLSKKLLAEAGYPEGLTLSGVLLSDMGSVRLGEIIKKMLENVNINWEIMVLESVAAADKYRNLEYDLGVQVAPFIRDPDSSITYFYDPNAEERFKRVEHPGVMEMIETARQELDREKRKQLYWDIEKAIYDNYDDAWLFHYTHINAMRKRLRGYDRKMVIEAGDAYFSTHPFWFKDGTRH
jgi:ABC-type transport system substrate-binding protein